MRFTIGDKMYQQADLYKITIQDWLLLQTETAIYGKPMTLGVVERMSKELEGLTAVERSEHPNSLWVLGIYIWASRRVAGDALTFAQAIDIPLHDVTFLPEPEDHKSPNPTKGRPRKGSGPAVKRVARPAAR